MSDVVRFRGADHVWFDRGARVLHCDRCPVAEPLEEHVAQDHIVAFANAHRPCPEVATEASRKAAGERAYAAGERAYERA